MEYLGERASNDAQAPSFGADLPCQRTAGNSAPGLTATPILPHSALRWNDPGAEWRSGEFFKSLSPKAMSEFESLATPFCCQGNKVLFTEEQQPLSVFFLLEGRVKLTMNSSEGKRLMLGIAMPGEILGLAAVVTGCPYEITAVSQFPCRIIGLPRKIFFDFLLCHPVAWENSARLLCLEYKRGCEQLRLLGLSLTASIKLARLLLLWSTEGQRTGLGARIHCSLTHEEIGEYIGLSRETVTRNHKDFKNHELVVQRGSTLVISSLRALEIYAGQVAC